MSENRVAQEALLQIQAIADMIRSNYSWTRTEQEAVQKAARSNPALYEIVKKAGLMQ